ncbi:DUF6508 domain-containing protein [Haloplasma contractile]|uniref:Uncharacterized protein n=1 Tax=Haloplasma contractile SSD-17B TaxID=1033810 RepID=U2FIV0_9MOLU|nr:DUF6508 domain-containing protein [Haloplasma contractile]ERJ11184.1 hypothetical protein HLPCO_002753 [Haloplasma contractile SSD-17B]
MEEYEVASNKLIDYIPYFESGSYDYYFNKSGFFTYDQDVNYFFLSVINECYKYEVSWQDFVTEFDFYYQNQQELDHTDLETLKKLLITIKSLERYRHGIIALCIDHGLLLAILNRIKMLS